jgi:NADPH:quinone reductase
VPQARLAGVKGQLGRSMTIGNEGTGTVVAAGRNASGLEGARVGMARGSMYADYRKIRAEDVMPLPDDADVSDSASMIVNPLTRLGFVETAKAEGHKAIMHTPAHPISVRCSRRSAWRRHAA